MSASEIRNFQRQYLKKTETNIRTCHGTLYVEKFDQKTGKYSSSNVGEMAYGWVGCTKPDLQLAEVRKKLFLGSQDVASDFELLQKHGITHILNLAPAVENAFPENFTYHKVSILDVPETDIISYFEQTDNFISSALSSGGSIFAHCNAGVSRAPSIVSAYLMRTEGISAEKALESIKRIRPTVSPNRGFLEQLHKYEKQIHGMW